MCLGTSTLAGSSWKLRFPFVMFQPDEITSSANIPVFSGEKIIPLKGQNRISCIFYQCPSF